MATKKFSWKIWGMKILMTSLAVLLAGGVSVWQENPYWLAILPVLTALNNYLKNK